MAYYVKNADTFGRIGTGIGKGLAEQLPKEIEHNRLASGLQSFEQESQYLNPVQQVARAGSIRGITPQMLQSLTDAARIQNQGNAYRNRSGQPQGMQAPQGQGPQASADITPVEYKQFLHNAVKGNIPGQQQQQGVPSQQTRQAQPAQSSQQQNFANPNENTFNPNAKTLAPWTQERIDQEVEKDLDRGFLPNEAIQRAKDREARELGLPRVLQERQAQDMERTALARNELDRLLDLKLQKSGDAQFKDVIGEMKANIQRQMLDDVRTNPDLTIEKAADKWSNKALSTAKAKGQLDKEAKTSGPEVFFKGNTTLKKLEDYSDIFRDSGNSEEYYNILKKSPAEGGFGLSSEGSATIAFPLSSAWTNYLKSDYKPNHLKPYREAIDPKNAEANSRKAARDLSKNMTENDSFLTAARDLKERDLYFDQEAFFDEIKQNKDRWQLNDRQRLEIPERNTDILPKWGDFLVLPWRTKK